MPSQAKDIFDANTQPLREVLTLAGTGLYIPAYQRPYGWSVENVNKLLDDVLHGIFVLPHQLDNYTFLGTVITIHDKNYSTINPVIRSDTPPKVLTVIDGQQRLSTLIALTVALHGLIRKKHWQAYKGKPAEVGTPAAYLHDETVQALTELKRAFSEESTIGDVREYPRMIRAFDDAWARRAPQYAFKSALARLSYDYSVGIVGDGLTQRPNEPEIKVTAGESDGLSSRTQQMSRWLLRLAADELSEEGEGIPSLQTLAGDAQLQKALMNHELSEPLAEFFAGEPDEKSCELLRLLLISAYVLNRVAMTVVQCDSEDYAFTIFESLNTTGEPLTAFETFAPRVVNAEGLAGYDGSEAKSHMDEIKAFLESRPPGKKRQLTTSEMLVAFAAAESGQRLSKRLPEQRAYLRTRFEGYANQVERNSFLEHLRNTQRVLNGPWNVEPGAFTGLPADATTDTVRLCLSFLSALGHSVTVPIIVRFYTRALQANASDQAQAVKDLESALKAVVAFSVFWRSSRETTGNIDQQYREIMVNGVGNVGLSRSRGNAAPPEDMLNILRAGLQEKLSTAKVTPISTRSSWISAASHMPVYRVSRPLARFLLLASSHDAVGDPAAGGLLQPGKAASNSCLDYGSWTSDDTLSLEHVAPRDQSSG